MKIAIIGAGAMGSLYGGYLSGVEDEVFLVDISQEHVDAINSGGLIIEEKDREVRLHPRATTKPEDIGQVDLAIVFVKSFLTGKALEKNVALLGQDTIVMSLQNGYGNIDQIAEYVRQENIIAGTTSHGASMLSPGRIRHAGTGDTHIGWVSNDDEDRINGIAGLLRRAGFVTAVEKNVMELVWSKLIINVGINALTAVLRVRNKELLRMDETKDILRRAVLEAVEVAAASGAEFDGEEMVRKVMGVAFATGENSSSMLQDIINRRKTEIDTINGAIVREGGKHSVGTPVNSVLVNLVRALEKLE
ncbi:MAG: 2-dehydropantoate 2-reductase [Firmicutes bacterium]|nr:2-dehydropantoate 2-reductase [Bacillota bacterium]